MWFIIIKVDSRDQSISTVRWSHPITSPPGNSETTPKTTAADVSALLPYLPLVSVSLYFTPTNSPPISKSTLTLLSWRALQLQQLCLSQSTLLILLPPPPRLPPEMERTVALPNSLRSFARTGTSLPKSSNGLRPFASPLSLNPWKMSSGYGD